MSDRLHRSGAAGRAALLAAVILLPRHARADAVPLPSMSGPLAANPNPAAFDAGPLGMVQVTGALSGLGLWQDNRQSGDRSAFADLSNADLFVQRDEGWLQFFVQTGAYSLPSLGTPYVTASQTPGDTFGFVPLAFLKLVPSEPFSVQIGKLPSLIGAESIFTFENQNIERGLLWNQTSSVSRGIQLNYTNGPVALSLSWNDGYYSNRFNWATGLAAYTLDGNAGTVTLVGGANLGRTGLSSAATPLAQNNSAVFDLIYAASFGHWTVSPYIQLSKTPADRTLGFLQDTTSEGAALLASCKLNESWSVAARGEFLGTHGAVNLAYGPGSAAWSLTLTPTYQTGVFFARAEASYVGLADPQPGLAIGRHLDSASQARLVLETGMLF